MSKVTISPRTLVSIYSGIAILEGLGAIGLMASIPADTKNSLLLGFSLQRIMLILVVLAGMAGFAVLGAVSLRRPAWAASFLEKAAQPGRKNLLLAIFALLFLAGWVGSFLPSYRLFPNQAYFERLQPIIIWLTLLSAQTLLALILACFGVYPADLKKTWSQQRSLIQAAAVAAGVFALIWGGMLVTRVGITPDDRFWNEAGVPVLALQALLAWAASLIVAALFFTRTAPVAAGAKPRFLSGWKLDLLICALLWLAASLFWTQTPMPRSYFAPGPYMPNNVYYPYSDALIHDKGAQFALIGQGLNNNDYFDKPFYLLFLAVLHMAAGQDYSAVTQLQAVCLALFPALLYLIGKSLHSRTAGLLVGMFAIIQETNAIAATLQIQVSTSRLLMSEFPTAFGMALLCLVLVWWFKRPQVSLLTALIAGGILGTLVLTRTSALLVIPFVLLAFLLVFWRKWRRWLSASGLLLLGVALVVGPWFVTNRTADGRTFIEEKIMAVFALRYDTSSAAADEVDAAPSSSSTAVPSAPPAGSILPTAAPAATSQPPVSPGIVGTVTGLLGRVQTAFQFTPGHFFHNLDMSVLILPLSLRFDDLQHTLAAPFWTKEWDGHLPLDQVLFLAANLLIVAIGLGAAWHNRKLASLVPLLLLLSYYLSNALGRTSGSRYLVPAEWVVLVYFGLGLIQLSAWGATFLGYRLEGGSAEPSSDPVPARPGKALRSGAFLCAGLLLVGAAPLLIGTLFPQRYTQQPAETVLAETLARGSLQQAGVSAQDLASLAASPNSVITRGRLLYPRYYYITQGEPPSVNWASFGVQNYGRLIFQMIGPVSKLVILPLQDPTARIPDAADITVIGCKTGQDVWAQAVIIEGKPDVVYLRSPIAGWQCPLPPPICNNNRQCH